MISVSGRSGATVKPAWYTSMSGEKMTVFSYQQNEHSVTIHTATLALVQSCGQDSFSPLDVTQYATSPMLHTNDVYC